MNEKLPEHVNKRRRASVKMYSILAFVAYQIPVASAYLAAFLGQAKYTYYDVNFVYIGIITGCLTSLLFILTRREFSKNFIIFILYFQISLCVFHILFFTYTMNDLRILVLIGSLLGLMYVFIHSPLPVSLFLIVLISTAYLTLSYTSIKYLGQDGSFGREFMYVFMFIPVAFFMAYMSGFNRKQNRALKESKKKLNATFSELEFINEKLESYNTKMLDSIRYAEMIQRSLLPGIDRMKTQMPESFVIWMPKDIVGGDIFYTYKYEGGFLIALLDCTGHGVPGAFLTMIAYTEIRKIVMTDGCLEPVDILSRLNAAIRTTLHKDDPNSISEDGLDAAVCNVNMENGLVNFAGACIPLIYVKDGNVEVVKGDKQSLGYKNSDVNYRFTNHSVKIGAADSFYMCTDGYTDQLGGEKNLRFGKKRYKEMLGEINNEHFGLQREKLLERLFAYKGEGEQQDDITAIGFRV